MPSPDAPNVRRDLPAFAPGVREAIYRHVFSDPRNEVGGMLVGEHRRGRTVIIGAVAALGADGDVTSLTFTHDAWAHVHRAIDERYAGAEIVGWYHSHPGHGIFLSRHDRFIHQNFFSAAWQIAIVVDPQRHEEGLFAWQGDELVQVAAAQVDPQNDHGQRHRRSAQAPLTPPSTWPAPTAPPAAQSPAPQATRRAASGRTAAELAARRTERRLRDRRRARLTLAAWVIAALALCASAATQLPGW